MNEHLKKERFLWTNERKRKVNKDIFMSNFKVKKKGENIPFIFPFSIWGERVGEKFLLQSIFHSPFINNSENVQDT
jgi:hypothetical protein